MEKLFDLTEEYEEMLNNGLKFSGESKQFFLSGRVKDLKNTLPKDFSPNSILDFGCGTGETSIELFESFNPNDVVGLDTSEEIITHAQKRVQQYSDISFEILSEYVPQGNFELCYVNGVFHHIPLQDRKGALEVIYQSLAKNGYFAFFENNPYNLGTQLVMSKIPFDRDAVTLTYKEAIKLAKSVGFKIVETRFLFYFPKFLAQLRPIERFFVHIPLGAQYYVLCQK